MSEHVGGNCGKLRIFYTGQQAMIGHQQLSDTVGLYGVFFCTRKNRVNFAKGRVVVNRKIRSNMQRI